MPQVEKRSFSRDFKLRAVEDVRTGTFSGHPPKPTATPRDDELLVHLGRMGRSQALQ